MTDEPKEPRRAPFVNGAVPMRWEFDTLLNDISASVGESEYPAARAALCRAYDALVDERDEWKRRAELEAVSAYDLLARAAKTEAERDAALAALRAQGEIRLDIRHASDLKLRVGTLLQLHWKDLTPAQLDAIEAICNEALDIRPTIGQNVASRKGPS